MVLKQFATTVEGNHAIALVLFFRQSFDSRFDSKPCFSWRAEVRLQTLQPLLRRNREALLAPKALRRAPTARASRAVWGHAPQEILQI